MRQWVIRKRGGFGCGRCSRALHEAMLGLETEPPAAGDAPRRGPLHDCELLSAFGHFQRTVAASHCLDPGCRRRNSGPHPAKAGRAASLAAAGSRRLALRRRVSGNRGHHRANGNRQPAQQLRRHGVWHTRASCLLGRAIRRAFLGPSAIPESNHAAALCPNTSCCTFMCYRAATTYIKSGAVVRLGVRDPGRFPCRRVFRRAAPPRNQAIAAASLCHPAIGHPPRQFGAKNDYVLAMWIVVLRSVSPSASHPHLASTNALFLGAAIEVGIADQGHRYLFLPWLIGCDSCRQRWRYSPRAAAQPWRPHPAYALLIKTPHQWVRKLPAQRFHRWGFDSAQANGFFRWRNETFGWRATVSNAVRNASEQTRGRVAKRWNAAC